MAIATSSLHQSFRGAVGDFIFRTYNGKTVVSLRPVYKNETNTEARFKARNRFREATQYAYNAMDDSKLKSYYMQKARQLKLPNAYTAAITDFLRKAKAAAITRSSFAAKKGDSIHLKLSKSVFKINAIRVVAQTSLGTVLSEQLLSVTSYNKTFELILMDDWPDFARLRIFTDEPDTRGHYTIERSDFIKANI